MMTRSKLYLLAPVLLLALAWSGAAPAAVAQSTAAAPKGGARVVDASIADETKLKVFEEVWENVQRRYFDERLSGADWRALHGEFRPRVLAAADKYALASVLQEMLNRLPVSHLDVWWENFGLKKSEIAAVTEQRFDPKKYELAYRFGFSTRKFEDQWLVTRVDAASNAAKQGVRAGWTAKSIDGRDYPALDLLSRAPAAEGQFVFLDEQGNERRLQLRRTFYIVPRQEIERESRVLPGGALYLKFANFVPEVEDWFEDELARHAAAPAVVVDLRGNGGGYVATVKKMLSRFFPKNTVVGEFIERDGGDKTFKVGRETPYRGRLIVLTDNLSASGAEIFAAAVQEQRRGRVVGEKTAGAVLASVRLDLPADFKLSLPVRDYVTAGKARLEGRGVTPDVAVVTKVADFRSNYDRVLEEAKRLVVK